MLRAACSAAWPTSMSLDPGSTRPAPASSRVAFRETGNRLGELQSLSALGGIDRKQGRFDDAVARLEQSLSGFRELGWQSGEAEVLLDLGEMHREQGRLDAAVVCLKQSLRLMRAVGDRLCEAPILRSLALTHSAHRAGSGRRSPVWSRAWR